MITEKMREEFEARYPLPSTCEGFNGGFYFFTDIYSGKEKRHPHHQKWLIWQDSRASIEVDLTALEFVGSGESIRICHEAIKSLGLKVKP